MAHRQRSFFDQPTESRCPQWHGGNKYYGAARTAPHEHNQPPVTMPPIPASSASRSKLQAFQFHGLPEDTESKDSRHPKSQTNREAEKENQSPSEDQEAMASSQLLPCPPPMSQRSQHKECPQTPVGRLPLAELIAGVDDNTNQNLNLTPIERVLWQHVPGNTQFVSSQEASVSRTGKKRARSSSPTSSSQNETSHHFQNNKQSFDLQTLEKTLKTPQADPAADLWTRYSLKIGIIRDGSPSRNATVLADLLKSSSPQTPGSHLKQKESAGLRRSISCANEWPTSAAKRRRLNHTSSQNQTLDECPAIERRDNARMSRVNLLVEQIQNGLLKGRDQTSKAKPSINSSQSSDKHASDRSSSSLPFPDNHGDDGLEDAEEESDPTFVGGEPAMSELDESDMMFIAKTTLLEGTERVSDFDDDDFDDDLLEAVDASMAPRHSTEVNIGRTTQTSLTAESIETTMQKPIESTTKSMVDVGQDRKKKELDSAVASTSTTKPNVPAARFAAVPEAYDEDDNDMSAADIEDLLVVFDKKSPNRRKQSYQSQPQQITSKKAMQELKGSPVKTTKLQTHTKLGSAAVIDVSSDEEYGEEIDFDDIGDDCTEKTQIDSQLMSRRQRYTIQRYRIIQVAEGEYTTDKGYTRQQKVLVVQPEKSKLNKAIVLRQSWVRSPCSPDSFVHLIGQFDRLGQCIVDDHQNMLILHPDHLVSATVVGDSFSCTRRAVLQDRVKATNDASEAQVYGHILHEIFQEALTANRWDDEWLHNRIETIASRYLESFFEINLDPIMAVDQLKSKSVALQSWADIFVSAKPKAEATIKDRNGASSTISVNKLLGVEEKVWSPMYGLKGNVDASVQITMSDESGDRTLTVPFELKTGKHSNAAHKAQTALYTLLLSDRYDIDVACGILYYMDSAEMSRVPAIRHELMHMVMQRNELASYIRQRIELPPMLKSPHLCGRCYAKTSCFIYHKLTEGGDGETSGMKDKFDEVVRHLNPADAAFFKRWDDLLSKEEKDVVKIRRELWTMQSVEREKVGRCFSSVIIEPGSASENDDAQKINRYHYAFVKRKSVPGFSFLESQITTGEPIVISDERGHFALANGYITAIRKRRIEVAVDRQLNNARTRRTNFNSQDHQSFVGVMEVVEQGSTLRTLTLEQPQETTSYRIDKDEFSNGMATVRNNLISLMAKDVFGSQPLRRLIIENAAPTFRCCPSSYSLGDSVSQASLNVDQRDAIEKVMSAKDYALVLGMPGTGKTTTIAHIIRALTTQGKSVLLTSYTHTAVDNILLKIRHDNIGVFRLGATAKVHPDVQEFADLAGSPMKSIEEIKKAYSRPVVATTCLGINHSIFNQKLFDVCIVDEASQITLPVCLGPIRMARSFILVGDHNQLPPLVQNSEAREGGLDVSLFKMLSDNQPSSVVNLEHQYRMCEDIMLLSNTLIYNGRLKCGNNAVAQRSVRIPRMEALKQHHHTPSSLMSANLNPRTVCLNSTRALCWIRDLLDPSTKACFVNTDTLLPLSRESETGSRIVNTCEATLCTQLVQSLLTTGVPATDIGVITLYRSQLALIKQNLRQYYPAVEMHTADKFQGRDKDVIILSLVRSNESRNVGDLLKDWRRVNVAFTRARTKLLILGSKSTLNGNDLLEQFVKLMDSKRWIYDLPKGAMEGHVFDDGATPFTARSGSHEMTKPIKVEAKKSPAKRKRIDSFFHQGKQDENRRPVRVGKMTERALLGSRPVLRDIVNDAS
ncbi:MAG: hypothetical protein L6R38_005276 [Xanthoria sp. 2 TBL-2021]|nr:MAG: hypothetical protein L6R38_005276 [Xanthoria sp. 2 TBL-2021]